MYSSTVTQKGQVTIPVEVRKKLGVKKGSKIEFVNVNGETRIKKAQDFFSLRGALKGRGIPTSSEIEEIAMKEAVRRYKGSFKRVK